MIKTPKKQLFSTPAYLVLFIFSYFIIPVYYGIKHRSPLIIDSLLLIYFFTAGYIYFLFRQRNIKKVDLIIKKEKLFEDSNILDADITSNNDVILALRGKIQRYNTLENLTKELLRSFSLNRTIESILIQVHHLMACPNTTVLLYLLDTEKQKLSLFSYLSDSGYIVRNKDHHLSNAEGLSDPGGDTGVSANGDIFDLWVLKHQTPLIVEDTKSDFRFDIERNLEASYNVGSLIIASLIISKRTIGILRMNSKEIKAFTSDDLRFLSVVADLAALSIDNSRLYQHTQQLAITDGLTGFYLRHYFLLRLAEQIKQAKRDNGKFSLLMVDIDRFKNYNDKFGHISGDILLTRIANSFRQVCPSRVSVLSRYGGEEFIILLFDKDKEEATRIAEDLRKLVESREVIVRRKKSVVTVSVGVSSFPEDGTSSDELVHKADSCLYKAKQAGRNRVCSL